MRSGPGAVAGLLVCRSADSNQIKKHKINRNKKKKSSFLVMKSGGRRCSSLAGAAAPGVQTPDARADLNARHFCFFATSFVFYFYFAETDL